MKKAYKEFLDNLSEFYTVGSEVELSYTVDYKYQPLYKRACDEGYIVLEQSHKGIPIMRIIRLPDKLSEEFVISYFN